MKKIIVLSLFPGIFNGFLSESLIKKAIDKKILKIQLVNLRNFGIGKHRQVDDSPFGGGPGMILRIDVMAKAVSSIKSKNPNLHTILLDPKGKTFNQKIATRLAKNQKPILLICGRYEGFDERIRKLTDEVISLGNFVLNGGEVAAQALIETISRQIPGFLGKPASLLEESFSRGLNLEYPQYTRPENYQGEKIPPILLSGNHRKIKKWRLQHIKVDTD